VEAHRHSATELAVGVWALPHHAVVVLVSIILPSSLSPITFSTVLCVEVEAQRNFRSVGKATGFRMEDRASVPFKLQTDAGFHTWFVLTNVERGKAARA
jgi:hypothetical protein